MAYKASCKHGTQYLNDDLMTKIGCLATSKYKFDQNLPLIFSI